MNAKHTYTIENLPADNTNLAKVKKMSERAINRAARLDPDAQLLTNDELKNFKQVHPPLEIDVKKVRKKLHMSQSGFARNFGLSLRTIQDWELGRRQPKGPARVLLTIIARNPRAAQMALLGAR